MVAIGVLVWELARDDLTGLVVFGVLLAAVAGARLLFRAHRTRVAHDAPT
jgi:hypothetical protein